MWVFFLILQYDDFYSNDEFEIPELPNGTICSYQVEPRFLYTDHCECGESCQDFASCSIGMCASMYTHVCELVSVCVSVSVCVIL